MIGFGCRDGVDVGGGLVVAAGQQRKRASGENGAGEMQRVKFFHHKIKFGEREKPATR